MKSAGLAATVLTAALSSIAADKDQEYRCLLVGTWTRAEDNDRVRAQVRTELMSSGRFAQTGTLFLVPESRTVRMTFYGTWKVEGGRLLYLLESTGGPAPVPKGMVTSDEIFEITDKSFVYLDSKGVKHVQTRTTPVEACGK
jgi:hypothetical protein